MIEPDFVTPPELTDVLEELRAREPIFHREEFGTTRMDFERMTTEDFWEVGASGRRYSRAYVLNELEKRFANSPQDVWEASGFCGRHLGGDVYLVTYTLIQAKTRCTRRATIWLRTKDGWKMTYHQGTVVADASVT